MLKSRALETCLKWRTARYCTSGYGSRTVRLRERCSLT
ncbi:hypothetical protein CKA32_005144 [Geitlerinema sp. FC II]|nr:hypothetical protein CKA32_005144 [Geitlerinema sp. FC II]